jgi:Domain of unknown function (DUF397)
MHELDLARPRWRKSSYSSANAQCVEVAHVRTHWRKSSYSGANGACVEVADLPEAIAVRDSKDPDGPKLIFTSADWRAFISAVTEGR